MSVALPITGNVAKGDDFFGRTKDLERLWRLLPSNHILLLAPRRVGKTSLMYRLREMAGAHGMRAAYRSVAGVSDELGFVSALYAAALELDGTLLSRLVARPEWAKLRALLPSEVEFAGLAVAFGPGAAGSWRDLGEALLSTLSRDDGARVLLLIDELPLFVSSLVRKDEVERARAFLEWFRDLRQRMDHVRWLLAGSVGLDSIAEEWRLTASINDLTPYRLNEFDPAETDAFLESRTRRAGYELTPQARAVLLRSVGWPIPFFLAHFIVAIDGVRDATTPVDEDAVRLAFQHLTAVQNRAVYSHWNERLDEQLPAAQASLARQILSVIANDPEGAREDTLDAANAASRRMLNMLLADGYIVQRDDDRWVFRSPLLRVYWQRFVNGRKA